MTQRLSFIDTLKGIGITLVVWGHCGGNPVTKQIYAFHIPLFFFLSGFLYKHAGFQLLIQNKARRLLVPYLFFFIVSFVFNGLLQLLAHSYSGRPLTISFSEFFKLFDGSQKLPYNSALWFLVSMFEVIVIYFGIVTVARKFNLSLVFTHILVAIATAFGYYLSIRHIDLPYHIDSSLSALVFFHLGNVFSNYNKQMPHSQAINIGISVLCFALVAFLTQFTIHVDCRMNQIPSNFMLYLIAALLGILGSWCLAKALVFDQLFRHLGKNSIWIMCVHIPLFILTDILLTKLFHIEPDAVFGLLRTFLTLCFSVLVAKFINQYLTFLR